MHLLAAGISAGVAAVVPLTALEAPGLGRLLSDFLKTVFTLVKTLLNRFSLLSSLSFGTEGPSCAGALMVTMNLSSEGGLCSDISHRWSCLTWRCM
jgi:hypothetical protein